MPQLRKDPIVDRWVIIAGERAARPQAQPQRVYTPESDACPFCAGNESMTPPPVLVLPGDACSSDGSWSLRVVPNKYPALTESDGSARSKDGLYDWRSATGVHEVVIETPRHIVDLASIGEKGIERILQGYRERMLYLRTDPRWQYILVYKNQGTEAGATLLHSHSQITALPIVPKGPLEEFEAARKHYASASQCIYCTIIQSERENGARIVAESEQFVVFCPFASRVAGETWIPPKRHKSSFEAGTNADLSGLAHMLHDLLKRLALRFHEPSFNYFIHGNPVLEPENAYYHWHLEILPKLQYVAGFEWGSGLFMNSLAPEDAARSLREVAI
jgi:UDPglucose--hexose-1-phosphate uridylyltransferase